MSRLTMANCARPMEAVLLLLPLLLLDIGRAAAEGGGASAEFAVLTIQSCRWHRPSEPASSGDLGDCWKAYSGYPFDCPRRDAGWVWDGSFVRPVNLQRVVVSGAPSNSELYRVAVWAGEPLPGPKRECRLEQSSGRVGLFSCVGPAGLGARAVSVGLVPRQRRCRLRLCGLLALDTDSRQLSFTDCRASVTPTAPSADWAAAPCWQDPLSGVVAMGNGSEPDSEALELAPAESPAWTGNLDAPASVGLVRLAACQAPGAVDELDATTTTTCPELEVATIIGSGVSGNSDDLCRQVAGPVATFDCGGRRAVRLTVARRRQIMTPMPTPLPAATAVAFELCNVVAYGLGTSSQYLFRG